MKTALAPNAPCACFSICQGDVPPVVATLLSFAEVGLEVVPVECVPGVAQLGKSDRLEGSSNPTFDSFVAVTAFDAIRVCREFWEAE
jgi:hypothetical protein